MSLEPIKIYIVSKEKLEIIISTLRKKCPYSEFSGPYSVPMRENTDHKNYKYGNFSRSAKADNFQKLSIKSARLIE